MSNWNTDVLELLSLAVPLTMVTASGKSVCYPFQPNFPVGKVEICIFFKAIENGWYLHRTVKMPSSEYYS